AQSVADFLRQQGVQCEIQVKGYGPDQPIASNKTKAGQRANRRIEMKILGTKASQPGASQGEAK
ncbi:MAG: OmpA family protein, partial [Fibrobacterales bacterium]|nr:OmpA family protein [Fibrobacterales bacterium]